MNLDKKIENIVKETIKSVINEGISDYGYDELHDKINYILNNIAYKNGWSYEEDQKFGKFIDLGGSQVFFDIDDDGRIYVSNINVNGMSGAENSRRDCQDLIKLLTIVNNSNLMVK